MHANGLFFISLRRNSKIKSYRFGLRVVIGATLFAYSLLADATSPVAQIFHFHNGGSAYFYRIDKSLKDDANLVPENLIFVTAGSGCASMGKFLPQYFTGLEGISGVSRIYVLMKRHISLDGNGEQCSDAFTRADHFSQWQADQREFIRTQLKLYSQLPRRIVLFGISEGAELVPVLAQEFSEVTHLILLSHSGMNAIDVYQSLARQYSHMRIGWNSLQQALIQQPEDVDNVRIHGRSWRYWSEISQVNVRANLLACRQPIFLGLGQADTLIPADSVALLRQEFQNAMKNNLDIREFNRADHGLNSPEKNFLPDFMWEVDNWLAR